MIDDKTQIMHLLLLMFHFQFQYPIEFLRLLINAYIHIIPYIHVHQMINFVRYPNQNTEKTVRKTLFTCSIMPSRSLKLEYFNR